MSEIKKRVAMDFVAMAEKSGKRFETTESLDKLKEKVANNPKVKKNLREIFKKIEKMNENNKLKAN